MRSHPTAEFPRVKGDSVPDDKRTLGSFFPLLVCRLSWAAQHRPIDTAGFKWQPEMWPIAYAIVSTVRQTPAIRLTLWLTCKTRVYS
jgi:hypothetical protein